MRLPTLVTCLVAYTGLALCIESQRDVQDLVKDILARQEGESSPEKIQCHTDCGTASIDESPDKCEDSEWTDLVSACLECALKFDIWEIYGEMVGPAAKGCGLDATPKEPEGTGEGGDEEKSDSDEEDTSAESDSDSGREDTDSSDAEGDDTAAEEDQQEGPGYQNQPGSIIVLALVAGAALVL